MTFRATFFLILILFVFKQTSFGQQSSVNVDPLTGAINVGVPICSVSNGSLSTSINLVYSGNGIKVKDVEGNGGIGWQVTGGGQITRVLRGLPDDIKKDNASNNRLGWIYNTNGSKINSLTIANTGTPNCTNETTDTASIYSNFSDLSDTEPDVFSINAPGLSCQFVFDNSHNIKTIPYQDLVITPTYSTSGAISGFTVVNDKGVKYVFAVGGISTRQTTNVAGSTTIAESTILYYRNQYYQFKYGISYTTSWTLQSMTDANNNQIAFYYGDGLQSNTEAPLELYVGSISKTTQYWTKENSTTPVLTGISGSDYVAINYANNYRTVVPMVSSVSRNGVNYFLNYSPVFTSGTNYYRYFLRSVSTDQCNTNFQYNFSYYGESYASPTYTTSLKDSTSKNIDFWGYQNNASNTDLAPHVIVNPSNHSYARYQGYTDNATRSDYSQDIAGSNRTVDTSLVTAGALKQINYYNNGRTTIVYESNDFYDPTGSASVKGGGIRTKKVITYDGVDSTKNIVRSYSYINPATGVTSGKPITLPMYAFTRPYTGSGTTSALWAASTVRSELDLSTDDHSILYSQVTLSQTGGGKTLFEFLLPATNYDLVAAPSCNSCSTNEWSINAVNVAGPGCTSAGFVSNDINTYPFSPNTNYDFERGLLKKTTNFNDAGVEVSESSYTYTRVGSPAMVTGFKFDNDATVKSYLKYQIYTSTGELSQQVTNKVFDLGSTSLSQQTSINYTYGSSYHKLPTLIQTIKSDGTVQNQHTQYSKDYNTTTHVDDYTNALYNLQLQNINIPVEHYSETQKSGVNKITTASLVKFKPVTNVNGTLYLPVQTLSFFDQDGVSSSSFAPSSISSGSFVNDSKYVVQGNDLVYDQYGFLQTSDDDHKHVRTMLTDSRNHLPVMIATNAAAGEIGYFSYLYPSTVGAFTQTSGTFTYTAGRPVQNSYASYLSAGAIFLRTITKNASTKNYIFSVWLNPTVTGSMNVVLTGSDNVAHTYTISFANTGNVWKYYELKMPVASLSSTFNVVFENMTSGYLAADDVLFYPENAEINTFAYDGATKAKIVQTNTNGVSNYFVSDKLGRLNLVYDQDKQITDRHSYNYTASSPFLDPAFDSNDGGVANTSTSVTFTSAVRYNPCQFTGITYTWNFGDGTTITADSVGMPSHTFTTTGSHTITLSVYAPGYGTKTASKTITILSPPPPPPNVIPVYYTNNTAAGAMTTVTFSQSGVVKYSFNASDFSGSVMVPAGAFTVTVHGTGTYSSVAVDATNSSGCLNYFRSNSYSYSVNLIYGNSLSITLNDSPCN